MSSYKETPPPPACSSSINFPPPPLAGPPPPISSSKKLLTTTPPPPPSHPLKSSQNFHPPPPPPLSSCKKLPPTTPPPPSSPPPPPPPSRGTLPLPLSKPKVQLDGRRRASCEIMLSKNKIPLSAIANAILALDSLVLGIDQVYDLIKFCPTEEEMEMLKKCNGDKEMLGNCEKFWLELMKVPRVESKLRVFAFSITFIGEVEALKLKLNTINNVIREVRDSVKLRQIAKTILSLGNPFSQGNTAWVPGRLRLKSLIEFYGPNAAERKAFMHYIRKILAQKIPELLEFAKDLAHLVPASKIQLKCVTEDMSAIIYGLDRFKKELNEAKKDGVVSSGFRKILKSFCDTAEVEVRTLTASYTEVGMAADTLTMYFLDDPASYPFEEVIQSLVALTDIFTLKEQDEINEPSHAEK